MSSKPHILVIDGYNFIHRARSGFTKGGHSVVFNFFRNLRAIVGQFKPTRVIITLEGHPQHRYDLEPEYKANRIVIDPTDKEKEDYASFQAQKHAIITLLKKHFPIALMHHPLYEGDDMVFNIINNSARGIKFTVVSNDSDFLQLYDHFPGDVNVYNPMKKEVMTAPDYDYVTYKSLCGDASDNIKGIKGVGTKTAEKLARSPELLKEFLKKDNNQGIFEKNLSLIRFHKFSDDELKECECSSPLGDNWEQHIKDFFDLLNFSSLTKEKTFKTFIDTFSPLWGYENT